MLDFDNNGEWKGKGILSLRFRNSHTIQEVFKALIDETKEAGQVFQRFMKNDNRLVGQERHDLAEELEDLLGGFFLLYKTIASAQEGPFDSQYCEKENHFTMEFDGTLWRARGILKHKSLSGSFSQWFNSFLLVKTGLFIKNYGDTYSDGIMDLQEKEILLCSLNELIFQVLCAEKGLKEGILS